MCGIAGLMGSFEPGTLEEMSLRLAHRGPDGAGTWTGPALPGSTTIDPIAPALPRVGLAHRRLSIIDLSSAASQPMSSVGGRYQVIYNGEIYNYRQLARTLTAEGYEFNTRSDTAILGPLYDRFGVRMLDHLEGMYAFAIYDIEQGILFLARDHAGIKPLYHASTPGGFAFASELKALLALRDLEDRIDPWALEEYLTYFWTPDTRTMLESVRKLRPGHWMKVRMEGSETRIEEERWYRPPLAAMHAGAPVYDEGRSPGDLGKLIDEVVAEQCVSDVPFGAFLSGGVDSSAIVASMVATGHRPSMTYCIGFEGNERQVEGFSDDLTHAHQVARHLGVALKPVIADPRKVLDRLPSLAMMLDEPQGDSAPLFVEEIARVARSDGITVLMSGTGGDDVFSGYRRHLTARIWQRLGRARLPAAHLLRHGASVARLLATGLPRMLAVARRMTALGRLLDLDETSMIRESFQILSHKDIPALLNKNIRDQILSRTPTDIDRSLEESAGQDPLDRMLAAELAGFVPDNCLNYSDKASMQAGVEVRVPLLDRRLIAFMAGVPPRSKLRGVDLKSFFKISTGARLPPAVLTRGKTGLGAPVHAWLTGPGKSLVEGCLFESPVSKEWYDLEYLSKFWRETIEGRVDGAHTVLAACMAVWWREGFRGAQDSRRSR